MSDATRRRILLVEDEESLAGSIRYSLEQEGFTVTLAVDGRSLRVLCRPSQGS